MAALPAWGPGLLISISQMARCGAEQGPATHDGSTRRATGALPPGRLITTLRFIPPSAAVHHGRPGWPRRAGRAPWTLGHAKGPPPRLGTLPGPSFRGGTAWCMDWTGLGGPGREGEGYWHALVHTPRGTSPEARPRPRRRPQPGLHMRPMHAPSGLPSGRAPAARGCPHCVPPSLLPPALPQGRAPAARGCCW